jgi:multidrug transporter EmrE-like cation transporter
MSIANLIIIFIAVFLSAVGQIFLKIAANIIGPISLKSNVLELLSLSMNIYLLIGLISYFISTIIWIVALSRVSVSIAYPMISLGYVFVALAAWFLFNEPLSPIKLLALGIIIFGIILLAHSSN